MSNLITAARELSFRQFIKAKLITLLLDVPGFDTPYYFAAPQDFAATVEEIFIEGIYKVRYSMLSFAGFVDSKTRGCDENPSVFMNYDIQLFRQDQEARDGQPNSHDLLIQDMCALRESFLRDRDIEQNKVTHSALVMRGEMAKALPCEHVSSGVIGDWINFRLTIEVNA